MRYFLATLFSAFLVTALLYSLTYLLSAKPEMPRYFGDRYPTPVRDAPMYDRDYRIPPVELLLHLVKRINKHDVAAIQLALEIYSTPNAEEFLITRAFEGRILGGIWNQIKLNKRIEEFYYRFCNNRPFEGPACRSGHPIICDFPPPFLNLAYFRATRAEMVAWAKEGSRYPPAQPVLQ